MYIGKVNTHPFIELRDFDRTSSGCCVAAVGKIGLCPEQVGPRRNEQQFLMISRLSEILAET